jgi:hypothetical protein
MFRFSYTLSIVLSLFISLNGRAEINYQSSFKSLGYANGIQLKNDANSKYIQFTLPDAKLIKQAVLKLDLEYAQVNIPNAQIDVLIEDKLLNRIDLTEQNPTAGINSKKIEIILPAEFLNQKHVTVHFELSINTNSCSQEYDNAKQLILINPSSTLELTLNQAPLQINDFLSTLPEIVYLQIPSRALAEREFSNIAYIATAIGQKNKTVKLVEYNTQMPKHFIFGTHDELLKYYKITTTNLIDLAQFSKNTAMTFNSSVEQDIRPFFKFDSEILNQKNITELPETNSAEIKQTFTFKIPQTFEESYKGQRWTLSLKNHELPGEVVAKTARVQLITPHSTNGTPVLLFVYLDQMLVHAQELEANGKLEDLSIDLPLQIKKHGSELSIQVMRSDITRVCGFANHDGLISQLGPDSGIEFSSFSSETKTLAEFARKANQAVTISLPATALSRSINWLAHVQLMLNSIDVKLDGVSFDFYQSQPKPDITSAHIILSPNNSAIDYSQYKLDVKDLRNLYAIQLAQYQDKTALIYQTGNFDLPPTFSHFAIDDSTGIVFEQTRVLKHLPMSRIEEQNKTKEMIGELEFNIRKYRYYIFAVLWLILTLAFIRIGKLLK